MDHALTPQSSIAMDSCADLSPFHWKAASVDTTAAFAHAALASVVVAVAVVAFAAVAIAAGTRAAAAAAVA